MFPTRICTVMQWRKAIDTSRKQKCSSMLVNFFHVMVCLRVLRYG